ncbi:protein S100-A4-like [Rhinophrynus dorsalis]
MANLENSMVQIIGCYKKYAGKDGDCSSLSQAELAELATKEFPTLCNSKDKDKILSGIFGQMDMDGDKKVDFKEFCIFLCCIMMALEEASCKK